MTSADEHAQRGIDFDRPKAARVYDYILGGTLNYAIDRMFADKLVALLAPAQSDKKAPPNGNSQYRLGPDSLPQEGVPKGEIRGPFTLPCNIYPGTQHTYWVYVPAQYDPAVPASLMIYNDGQAFMNPEGDVRAQVVMDNLIFRREIQDAKTIVGLLWIDRLRRDSQTAQ